MTRGPGTLYYAYVDFFEYLIPVTCSALDRIMVVANMVNVISFMVSHSITIHGTFADYTSFPPQRVSHIPPLL